MRFVSLVFIALASLAFSSAAADQSPWGNGNQSPWGDGQDAAQSPFKGSTPEQDVQAINLLKQQQAAKAKAQAAARAEAERQTELDARQEAEAQRELDEQDAAEDAERARRNAEAAEGARHAIADGFRQGFQALAPTSPTAAASPGVGSSYERLSSTTTSQPRFVMSPGSPSPPLSTPTARYCVNHSVGDALMSYPCPAYRAWHDALPDCLVPGNVSGPPPPACPAQPTYNPSPANWGGTQSNNPSKKAPQPGMSSCVSVTNHGIGGNGSGDLQYFTNNCSKTVYVDFCESGYCGQTESLGPGAMTMTGLSPSAGTTIKWAACPSGTIVQTMNGDIWMGAGQYQCAPAN